MARLYFDHNVTRHVGPFLWTAGHDLLFTRDPGMARLSDDAHLLASVLAGRVLISHDRADFTMRHNAWLTWPAAFGTALPPHAGILVLDASPPPVLARALIDFLELMSPARIANDIFGWRRDRGWSQWISGNDWEPYQPPADAIQE